MSGLFGKFGEWVRGGGEYAVTVPSMDGALRPNQTIEAAAAILSAPAPDNLVLAGQSILFSSGAAVMRLDGAEAGELHRFDAPVSALASGPEGALAIGLADGRVVIRGGAFDGRGFDRLGSSRLACPTALLFGEDGALFVAQGSATNTPDRWKHDLMERNASGSVWRIDLGDGKATVVADKLAWPYGLAHTAGGLAISESWRHRVVTVAAGGGAPKTVLDDLPGYPARIAAAADGGFWLSVFAPRSQLIEFVLREPEFRRRMMADIDPAFWAAPALSASNTFLEPLQGGAQKHLGMLKPWAPTRSYGLVVRLDKNLRPLSSLHSRADGTRHGVTSVVEKDGRLFIAAKGGDAIVAADTALAAPVVRLEE